MTLTEAIKNNNLILSNPPEGASQDFIDTIKLGIEALKHRQKMKEDGYLDPDDLLPGETEE